MPTDILHGEQKGYKPQTNTETERKRPANVKCVWVGAWSEADQSKRQGKG